MKRIVHNDQNGMRFRLSIAVIALWAGIAFTGCSEAASFYQLESAVTMKSASPDWDYLTLDPTRPYLYIGQRGDGVTVYDLREKKILRTIDRSEDANATTLVPEFDRGYTTNGDGTTTIFQLSTLKTLDRVKFGEDADNIFYEPVTHQLVAMMGDSKAIAFLDAKTGRILGRLEMESHKLDASVPDGQGNLFVAERDRNAIARIDVKNHRMTAEWLTEGCDEPTGLALDAVGKRLLIGCRGKSPVLAIMDSESGKMITTKVIGRGNDGVVFDAETHKVYTSNGVDGNLVIYQQTNPDTYQLAEAATTRPYARTMALDQKSKKVYMVTAEGTVDPEKKINTSVTAFYPNKYFANTFTLLTFVRK